mmetsp:Transcript_7206/g.23065  ORF Transcript_7206/g.23065 Transcript_7206/m.23065 type:complete len:241 (-) Transcript_7206:119-841(-)|eukprot:CAMPEP_0170735934 /NCGR_PEP_ID=MMETSP0437-20130122/3352_1 /TAXON_ID=0 /ORGANISM="Sexangularia sp." /LENGTH=240 /DNA_ID=CAMNT_0011074275 /DNA_START=102 /DNA_END=824 /DNA_ORIENTATION=-
MIVVCLEGCHGSGKTELTKQFASANFNVLDEAFFDMPKFSLHPQSLVMETLWVSHWMTRLLRKQAELQASAVPLGKSTIFIADRSPFSAVFYAKKNGHLLEPLIEAMIDELREHDVHIFNVHLNVDKDVLWDRIQARLAREPERSAYNEDDYTWMEKTVDFYSGRQWDFSVTNNGGDIREVMLQLLRVLGDSLDHLPALDFVRGPDSPTRQLKAAAVEEKSATTAGAVEAKDSSNVPVKA